MLLVEPNPPSLAIYPHCVWCVPSQRSLSLRTLAAARFWQLGALLGDLWSRTDLIASETRTVPEREFQKLLWVRKWWRVLAVDPAEDRTAGAQV